MFNATQPLQAAMRALFLVAFFSFLRKSNLVVPSAHVISPKVPRRLDFHMSQHGAFLNIRATRPFSFSSGLYAFHSLVSQVLRFVLLRLLNIIFASTQFAHRIHFIQFVQAPFILPVLLLFVTFPVF